MGLDDVGDIMKSKLLMLGLGLFLVGACTKKEESVKTGASESSPSVQSTVSNNAQEPVAGEPQGK